MTDHLGRSGVSKQPWELSPRMRSCAECDTEFLVRSNHRQRFCSESCQQRNRQRMAKRRLRERQRHVFRPSSLEAQLRALPPLAPVTEKVDVRTKEGKKQKPRLLKELIALRERGYLLAEISVVLGVSESTLSMWLIVAGRGDLAYLQNRQGSPANGYCHVCGVEIEPNSNGRPRKYCGTECLDAAGKSTRLAGLRQAEKASRAHQIALTKQRRERISALRAEYRRCRANDDPLPWRVLRVEPKLTVEQKMEVELIAKAQEREERSDPLPNKRRKGWITSLDEPVRLPDEPFTEGGCLADLVASPRWFSENAEIEALMWENGGGPSPPPVLKPPWRVRRPVREMYPDESKVAA